MSCLLFVDDKSLVADSREKPPVADDRVGEFV